MLKLYKTNSEGEQVEITGTERAELFQRDGTHKNLVISFPNGDGPDGIESFDNEHIVKESLRFTESICSEDYLKFGLAEKSVLEFKMRGIGNIKGKTINAKLVMEGKEKTGAVYSPISVDVPLGRFKVDSCEMDQSVAKICSVTAYGVAFNRDGEEADEDEDYVPGSRDVETPSNGVVELSPIEQTKRSSYWKNNTKYKYKPYEYTASAITGFEYSKTSVSQPVYSEIALTDITAPSGNMSIGFGIYSGRWSYGETKSAVVGAYYAPTLYTSQHADICTVDIDVSKLAISPANGYDELSSHYYLHYGKYKTLKDTTTINGVKAKEVDRLYYYPGQMIVTFTIFKNEMKSRILSAFTGKANFSVDESKLDEYLRYIWMKFAEAGPLKQGYFGAIYSYGSYASSAHTATYYQDKHMVGFGAHRYVYPTLSVKTGDSSDWKRITTAKYAAIPAFYFPREIIMDFTVSKSNDSSGTINDSVRVEFNVADYISQHSPEWLRPELSVDKLYAVTVPDSVAAANSEISLNRSEGKSPIYSKTAYYVATTGVNTDKSVVVDVDGTTTVGPSEGSGGSSASGSDIDIISGTAELQGEFIAGNREGDQVVYISILDPNGDGLMEPVDVISKSEYSNMRYETAGVAPYRKIVGEYTKTIRRSGNDTDGSEETSTRKYTLKIPYTGEIENTQVYDIRGNAVLKNQTFYGTSDANDTTDATAVSASISGLINTLRAINTTPYTAAELEMVGRPDIQVGDFINVELEPQTEDDSGKYVRLLVTRRTLKGIQMLRDDIESVGTDDNVAGGGSTMTGAEAGVSNDTITLDYITPEDVDHDICVWTSSDMTKEDGD